MTHEIIPAWRITVSVKYILKWTVINVSSYTYRFHGVCLCGTDGLVNDDLVYISLEVQRFTPAGSVLGHGFHARSRTLTFETLPLRLYEFISVIWSGPKHKKFGVSLSSHPWRQLLWNIQNLFTVSYHTVVMEWVQSKGKRIYESSNSWPLKCFLW